MAQDSQSEPAWLPAVRYTKTTKQMYVETEVGSFPFSEEGQQPLPDVRHRPIDSLSAESVKRLTGKLIEFVPDDEWNQAKDSVRFKQEFDELPPGAKANRAGYRACLSETARIDSGILGAEIYSKIPWIRESSTKSKRRRCMAEQAPSAQNMPKRKATEGKSGGEVTVTHLHGGYQIVEETQKEVLKSTTERRRKQMRVAQRNYRLRREATVQTLERRNKQLERVVEEMTKSFMAFQDIALKSEALKANVEVTKQLQACSRDFLELAKVAKKDSDKGIGEGSEDGADEGDEDGESETELSGGKQVDEENDRCNESKIMDLGNSKTLHNFYTPVGF